jgi:ArsR family transcriptional regulator
MKVRPRIAVAEPGLNALDSLFRGFADPTRLRILSTLAAGELCVCDLVELLGLPQPTVSRHLAYLRRAGLVRARRDLRFAYYRLAEPAHDVHANLLRCVRSCFRGIPALDAERARAEARARERAATACRP